MNTGQKLVELSGLPSGSALAHLLAITQGTGTGRTVFAARMAVCIEYPQVTLVQRSAECSVATKQAETETTQKDKPNRITALSKPARVDVTTRQPALFVVQKDEARVFAQSARNEVFIRRKRSVNKL